MGARSAREAGRIELGAQRGAGMPGAGAEQARLGAFAQEAPLVRQGDRGDPGGQALLVSEDEARWRLLRSLLEYVFGVRFDSGEQSAAKEGMGEAANGEGRRPAPPAGGRSQGARGDILGGGSGAVLEWGFSSMEFEASGFVELESGEAARFCVSAKFENAYARLGSGASASKDPLILDFGISGLPLFAQGRAAAPEGKPPALAGLGALRPGCYWLVEGAKPVGMDSGDAFGELARMDGDGNGLVDKRDPGYSRLALYDPSSGRIAGVATLGVEAIVCNPVQARCEFYGPGGAPEAAIKEASVFFGAGGKAMACYSADLAG